MTTMPIPDSVDHVLLDEETLRARTEALAEQISRDYAGLRNEDFVLVGVLKGSFIFLADLARRLTVPHRVDFIALSSYTDATDVPGAVRMIMDTRAAISGRHVLIVEDILDTGITLSNLVPMLKMRNPNSVKICTILDKPSRRKADIAPDYEGFAVPDEFVVGYGLDYDEKYRNLPYIGVLKPSVYEK